MAKKFEDLEFRDAFVFGRVMEDPELCRDFLSVLLQEKIGSLTSIVREKELRIVVDGKTIRLDIYATEGNGPVYDAEMQNLGQKQTVDSLQLPLRSRAYQSLIDGDLLDRGMKFKDLPESNVIFICTFDPFGIGKYLYSFENTCMEDGNTRLNDGTRRFFFNACSDDPAMPADLRRVYDYILYKKTEDNLTKRIESAVEHVKRSSAERSIYMKDIFRYQDREDEAREEGIELGIEQMITNALVRGKTCEEISEFNNIPLEKVQEIEQRLCASKS